MHASQEKHMEAAYQIFRLLKSTPGKGLLLEKSEKNDVEAYTNADWVGYHCLKIH